MECNHDCLHCPFEDCIAPDDDLFTAEEIRLSEQLDREAYKVNCEADYEGEEARRKRISDIKRRYRETHKAEEREYGKRYRAEHKAERSERNKAYYEANRERINARKRELRALNKATRKRKRKSKTTIAKTNNENKKGT